MPIYNSKPKQIVAMQWTGKNFDKIKNYFSSDKIDLTADGLSIETLEGTMSASINDYIIKGIKGEFYPCKPDIFERSYEIANN
jgi:hypothetical protein